LYCHFLDVSFMWVGWCFLNACFSSSYLQTWASCFCFGRR